MSSRSTTEAAGRSNDHDGTFNTASTLTSRKTTTTKSSRMATINENSRLQSYYASLESRIGYRLMLGGTRHFGYYEPPLRRWCWRINTALRRMEDELMKALNVPAGATVLDAGCGDGHVAIHMAKKGGLRVEGIDVVERHIQRAANNARQAGLTDDQVHVQLGDYHHLDDLFAPETFDGIYTIETFVHATEPRAVLQQFFRALKPGGHLAMHEYDHLDSSEYDLSAEGRVAGRALAIVNKYSAMPANEAFSRGVLEAMLEDEGFENIQLRDLSRNIWPMLFLFYVLAWIPMIIITLLGLECYFINTLAGYWSWRGREYWRYVQITACKPSKGADV